MDNQFEQAKEYLFFEPKRIGLSPVSGRYPVFSCRKIHPGNPFIKCCWLDTGERYFAAPDPVIPELSDMVDGGLSAAALFSDNVMNRFVTLMEKGYEKLGLPAVPFSTKPKFLYACDREHYVGSGTENVHRIGECSFPLLSELNNERLQTPGRIAYGMEHGGKIVSYAYATNISHFHKSFVVVTVKTAAKYRRRGYAKAVVSRLTNHFVSIGGDALYFVDMDNIASQKTAESVGFKRIGRMLTIYENPDFHKSKNPLFVAKRLLKVRDPAELADLIKRGLKMVLR